MTRAENTLCSYVQHHQYETKGFLAMELAALIATPVMEAVALGAAELGPPRLARAAVRGARGALGAPAVRAAAPRGTAAVGTAAEGAAAAGAASVGAAVAGAAGHLGLAVLFSTDRNV